MSTTANATLPPDLNTLTVPIRIALLDGKGTPRVVSLWYLQRDGRLYCATHRTAWIVAQLKRNPRVGFDISTNSPPYRGARGTGTIRLEPMGDQPLLEQLATRYLGASNPELTHWLLSRQGEELLLELTPDQVSQWDYSHRMQEVANG